MEIEILCKAVDGDMNQQPQKMRDNWNVLGIAVNHWHRIHVILDPQMEPGARRGVHAWVWAWAWAYAVCVHASRLEAAFPVYMHTPAL